jgi:hypothetical protein
MTDATELTEDQVTELVHAALSVAVAPPLKKGQYVYNAQVPWTRIDRLRRALSAIGVDWLNTKIGRL